MMRLAPCVVPPTINAVCIRPSWSKRKARVRSNFIISEFWDNEIRTLSGWAGYRFRKLDGQWKISAKQVNLLNCDQCIRNPSIIL